MRQRCLQTRHEGMQHWYRILGRRYRKQNSVKTASLMWSRSRRVCQYAMPSRTRGPGGKVVTETKKTMLLPQNHTVHMTSCARAATDCANRGLVSTAIQVYVPQPTLQVLFHSLQESRMPTKSDAWIVCKAGPATSTTQRPLAGNSLKHPQGGPSITNIAWYYM